MMTDPIGDMLTRLRNAAKAGHTSVILPYSRLKHSLANLLFKQGFLVSVLKISNDHPELQLGLRMEGGQAVIVGIERVSKPGCRVYVKWNEIPAVRSNQGFAVISTSVGIMTGGEAKVRRLGGEVICKVY